MNDIVVPDDMVTRECHCQIICEDSGHFFVVDGSTNGTFVNGVRIGKGVRYPLRSTDIIKIGRTPLPWLNYVQRYMKGDGITKVTVVGGSLRVYGDGEMSTPTPPVSPTPSPIPSDNLHPQPDNFLVWSILGTIFCCAPFGIVSIVNASKVDKLWLSGDRQGAIDAARRARTWFWWSFGVGLICSITYIIIHIVAIYATL